MSMPEQNHALEISVGLVGHRRERLPSLAMARLHNRLQRVFRTLAADWGKRPVVLVTGMADGADLIGASARPVEWRLSAILTKPPAELAQRMSAEDATELLRLLAQPDATVEVLSGKSDGYVEQAAAILSRVDLLVAVMDAESGGPGGTADSVAKASALGRPVLVVPPASGPARWLTPFSAEGFVGQRH